MRLRDCATLAHLVLNQWRSAEHVKRVQNRRLQKLVRHAYSRVPYYRELFDSNRIAPEDIRSAEDLRRVPVTTKADLLSLPQEEITARGSDLSYGRNHFTSGTTGAPLKVQFRRDDWTRLVLGNVRAFMACGSRPWDRVVAFVGRTEVDRPKPWYEYLGLWKQRDLSSWSDPTVWIESIRRWQPHTIVGCVITLRLLAEAIRDQGVADIRPRVVISGSNVLDDFTRQLLESVFQCEVVDFYGATEGGALAWECKKCHAYHISSDMVVLELLRGGEAVPEGEHGEVVITNLHYFAMPFIRYNMGDLAVGSNRPAACGRGLPLLERIGGRRDEWISLPSGRCIPCQPFFYAIQPIPGVRRWKVIQETVSKLTVQIVPDSSFGAESRASLEANLRQLLRGEIEPEIDLRASIPIDPVTKFRQVSSKVLPKDLPDHREFSGQQGALGRG